MLLTNYFNQKTLFPFAVEFIVEDMFPRPKMQLPVCDGYDNLTAHYLPFEMSVGVIFVSVMAVLFMGLFRSQFLQPYFVVMMKPRFIVIYENGCCYVHSIYQHKAILNLAFSNKPLDFIMNRNNSPSGWRIDRNFLS